MQKRIDLGDQNVRITRQVPLTIEVGTRTAALCCAVQDVVQRGIARRDIRLLAAIPRGIEQRRGGDPTRLSPAPEILVEAIAELTGGGPACSPEHLFGHLHVRARLREKQTEGASPSVLFTFARRQGRPA